MKSNGRILIMAGGTGGHVFPGLAVADELSAQGWEVLWLGTAERLEAQLVPKHGYAIEFIEIKGVRGHGLMRKIFAPWTLARAIWQARRVIAKFKPDVVLGMGGYASGPGGIAARLSGLPLVLHEQNAAAGMTNRYLAKIATKVMLAFPDAIKGKHTSVVGNPVRANLLSLPSRTPSEGASYKLLVVGGSLGAQAINLCLPQALGMLDHAIEVRHQVGGGKLEETQQAYMDAGVALDNGNIHLSEFIDDMADSYAWADVVLCRAGALTVSEIASVGLPAIFVPLPYAVDDHQTKNANYLVNAGAAELLPQAMLSANNLAQRLNKLSDPQLRASYGDAAKQKAVNDAALRVATACKELKRA